MKAPAGSAVAQSLCISNSAAFGRVAQTSLFDVGDSGNQLAEIPPSHYGSILQNLRFANRRPVN